MTRIDRPSPDDHPPRTTDPQEGRTMTITAYKGFDRELRCRGYQYAEGATFVHDGDLRLCGAGFHACTLPLDVLAYYPLTSGNRYHRVELDGVAPPASGDSKRVARKISIGAGLNPAGLIQAHVEAILDTVKPTTGDYAHSATTGYSANSATTGYSAHSATTGRYANSATTGDSANSATTGDSAHSATTGYSAHSATTGYSAHSATTGYSANSATTGDSAHSATTGYSANSATTGRYANSATTGDYAHSATTGYSANSATTGRYANSATTGYSPHVRSSVADPTAVAAVLGEGAARGVVGSWLVLTERDDECSVVEVRAVQVDGETIKPDTYYRLSGGRLVAVDQ